MWRTPRRVSDSQRISAPVSFIKPSSCATAKRPTPSMQTALERENQERVLGHHAIGVARCRSFPRGKALLQLRGGELDVERALRDVENNDVTVGDGGDGAAVHSFRGDVSCHQAMCGAG